MASKKQMETLTFIRSFRAANGMSPTYAEIAQHFGVRINAIQGRIKRLKQCGLISSSDMRHRSLVPTEE